MPRKRGGKGGGGRGDDDVETRLADAMRHPLRARMLGILTERPASPRDLAEHLGVRLSNTSYHVRVLRELRLIEVVAREPVRGALKTTYKALDRHRADLRTWERIATRLRGAESVKAVQEAVDGAAAAIAAGTFDRRGDRQAQTLKMQLDEHGWAEVVEIAREARERILDAAARAATRGEETGVEAFPAVASIFAFEAAQTG